MNENIKKKKDYEVYGYHGWQEQCKHITSEMYELTSAIQKYELAKRFYVEDNEALINIHEEVADVLFMINQIIEYYELQKKYIDEFGEFKRLRESDRIDSGYYEKKSCIKIS